MTTETISSSIEHRGVIKDITPKTIKVSLLNVSGCSTCHTKSTCSVSDVDNKIIDVVNTGIKFKKGEKVKIAFEKSLGPLALFIGYLLPFILFFLMIGLFVLMNLDAGTPQIPHSYMVGQQSGVQPY